MRVKAHYIRLLEELSVIAEVKNQTPEGQNCLRVARSVPWTETLLVTLSHVSLYAQTLLTWAGLSPRRVTILITILSLLDDTQLTCKEDVGVSPEHLTLPRFDLCLLHLRKSFILLNPQRRSHLIYFSARDLLVVVIGHDVRFSHVVWENLRKYNDAFLSSLGGTT
jgi:hypothetical protein